MQHVNRLPRAMKIRQHPVLAQDATVTRFANMRPYIGVFHEYYYQRGRLMLPSRETVKSRRKNTRIRFKRRSRARLAQQLRREYEDYINRSED